MPLSGVTFSISQNGIGRQAPSKDKITGLLWYSATLPAGFATNSREKKVLTVQDAEALGIIETDTAFGVLWYQVSEFFRMNPEGVLWIGIYAVPGGTYDFTEITSLETAAAGEIRQLGIYANLLTFASTQVTAIQGVQATNDTAHRRASVIYAPNFASGTDWSAIADLRALTAPKVTVLTGQDGGGKGAALFASKAFSIPCLGAVLGAISRAQVNVSIGNPENFNFSSGTELEVIKMASGTSISDTVLGAVKDKGYLVMRKYLPMITGSYAERAATAVSATNDFAWLEFNRTMDKAVRQLETRLTPKLQSPVGFKPDGTLSDDVIGYFTDECNAELDLMKAAGEISNYKVLIDPTQNVQATSTLAITVKIQPYANAEFITVKIGFTKNV